MYNVHLILNSNTLTLFESGKKCYDKLYFHFSEDCLKFSDLLFLKRYKIHGDKNSFGPIKKYVEFSSDNIIEIIDLAKMALGKITYEICNEDYCFHLCDEKDFKETLMKELQ